jgi:hypothetical protein
MVPVYTMRVHSLDRKDTLNPLIGSTGSTVSTHCIYRIHWIHSLDRQDPLDPLIVGRQDPLDPQTLGSLSGAPGLAK